MKKRLGLAHIFKLCYQDYGTNYATVTLGILTKIMSSIVAVEFYKIFLLQGLNFQIGFKIT